MSPSLFKGLSPIEQWQLHDYFQPAHDWSKGQLLAHRRAITAERPSLPNQAGKAWASLHRRRPMGLVRPVVMPQPDVQKLAAALLMLVEEERRKDP